MKLHFTHDWLRSHIENDPDVDCDAGLPLRDTTPLHRFVSDQTESGSSTPQQADATTGQKSLVLHMLVYQLRRKEGLSIAKLAEQLRVDEAELKQVETNPSYIPKPRTIHQLAIHLKVPAKAIELLTAASSAQNDNLTAAAHRFAARSEDLSKLSTSERREFNDFVKVLASMDKDK
ncbi:helix-turn-helix transcriptional regulator [Roseibium sp. HPY-6]|uniref:helix-turn-helix domain-containing protein n=1 Tax=Roseibium sp. HPY-6 TaxID=3229852 RepID=UPI00338E9A15